MHETVHKKTQNSHEAQTVLQDISITLVQTQNKHYFEANYTGRTNQKLMRLVYQQVVSGTRLERMGVGGGGSRV